MRKTFIITILLLACTITVFGATYKVNTSGQVTSPKGTVQNGSSVLNESNVYSNYNAQNYINTQQVMANQSGIVDIVMDFSGSMYNWINISKQSMGAIVKQLPTSTKIGLRVFGHDGGNNPYDPTAILNKVKSVTKVAGTYKIKTQKDNFLGDTYGSCSATSQIVPVMTSNASALLTGMKSINLGGSTPLTLALKQAVITDFANIPINFSKKIVLITDGGENCGGDPCAFAKDLVKQRHDITIDVVLVSSASRELKCVADITGGKVYSTNDPYSFVNILTTTMQDTPPAQEYNTEEDYNGQEYEYIPY